MLEAKPIFLNVGIVCACAASVFAGCYVCGEHSCEGCSAGTITSCEDPTRDAEPGEAGNSRIVYPPHAIYCRSWDNVDANDLVDGPCDPPPSGYTLLGGCGAGSNCCFLDDDVYNNPTSTWQSSTTPACGGGSPCTGPV